VSFALPGLLCFLAFVVSGLENFILPPNLLTGGAQRAQNEIFKT
jgi:hypothetical protein